MSSEATVRTSLQIKKGNLLYQSQPTAFVADVSGTNGPTPGVVTVTTAGININLAQLTALGGLCWIMNLSTLYSVHYGIKDTYTGRFYPIHKLKPGEFYPCRLSDYLQQELGTGTVAIGDTSLEFRSVGGSCNVLVEAFDP